MCLLKNRLSAAIIILFTGLLVSSCSDDEHRTLTYFNIDSLIDENVSYLSKAQPMLEKHATVGSKSSVVTIIPKDSVSWSNELDIFRELDRINRPINQGSYRIKKDLKDAHSNLNIYRFTSTSDLPLKLVEIYYQHSLSQIRQIRGTYSETNRLYSSARYFVLEMRDVYNKNVVTSYFIEGGQKMILGDSVSFKILSNVVYPDKK